MIKAMVTITKVLWICLTRPPKQDFVNELYARENAKWYKRHAGIGNGPSDVPDGKYLKRGTHL